MKILSLGWGVQSWTLAAMVALKELPPLDFVIHADTTWETQRTYEFATIWGPWLIDHDVKLITVSEPEQAKKATTFKTDIPAFTVSAVNNIHGQLRRQCTGRWKITPIRRFVAEELARRGLSKSTGIVEQWLGITTDEWQRAKDSDVQYITHRYPLLQMDMSRGDCIIWLQSHGLPVPPKSACTFCPYHSKRAWEEMKREGGADWTQAIEIDLQIRDVRPPYPLYVHPARVPLAEAVNIPEDYDYEQLSLIDDADAECGSGYCFI